MAEVLPLHTHFWLTCRECKTHDFRIFLKGKDDLTIQYIECSNCGAESFKEEGGDDG